MTEFKIGDVVRIKNKVELVDLVVRDIAQGFYECVSTCGYFVCSRAACDLELVNRVDPQADLKQAIREVLLSDEFMTAFAAAWMKTPIPMAMQFDNKDGERVQSLADYPFGEPSGAKAIPGAPVGWQLVGFKQIQDDVKVFDEDGDYWTFGGTNDAGDLTGALMPIFQRIEVTNDPA